MSVFSTNQVRHLYVAKALSTPTATSAAGTIAVKSDNAKNHMYFEYKGAESLMRSDLIDIKNILYVKATDADAMAHELKAVTVTLDSSINKGAPVTGQDYIVRIVFKQFIGMSDEDQYFKYGMVHAYAGMSTSDFYKILAESLAKNFSREVTPLVDIVLTDHSTDSDTAVPVLKNGQIQTLPALADGHTYTAVVIDEVEQPWRLGVMPQTPVNFDVQFIPVTVNGDDVIWGKAEDTDPAGTIANGKKIADLEYFCMGERGDIYRGVGFPNNIPTTYLVDPTVKYNVIDIHYAYVGSNESAQKSEKTITLVVPKVGANNKASNALANSIITAINTATGLTVGTLDVSEG